MKEFEWNKPPPQENPSGFSIIYLRLMLQKLLKMNNKNINKDILFEAPKITSRFNKKMISFTFHVDINLLFKLMTDRDKMDRDKERNI